MSDSPYYIFLVDDDEDDRDLFKDALKEISIKTKELTFNNAIGMLAHLEHANEILPQVIFLDLQLPVISGEECLQKIRENPSFDDIPIVIYSTSFVQQMVDRLKGLGANFYIQKPSSYALLKSILERSISKVLNLDTQNNDDIDFIIKENK